MWGRSLAAAVLGLPLSTLLVGLIALVWPGSLQANTLPWLLLSFPVWIGVMSLAFLCRSGLHAWLWLGGASVLCAGLLQLVKVLGWTELSP